MGFLTSIGGALFEHMQDPTGFVNRTTSTLAFDSGTRTFTIAPTGVNFEVYSSGQLFYKTAESIVITNVVGLHYIYYVAGTTLIESTTAWEIASVNVPIAIIFWNGTTGYLYDERHGMQMDGRTHEYLHETIGARYALGMELTIATNCLTHTIAAGEWYDDDIEWLPPAQSSTPFMYLISSAWQKTAAQAPAFYTVGGIPQYNNPLDVDGLVDVTNNRYFVTWILTTNTYPNSEAIFVMGRGQYFTQSLAEAEAPPALSTAPSAEILYLYQIVMQRNGASVVWKHTSDLRRTVKLGTTYVATDHGALAGLLDDDHTQYPLLAGRTGGQTLYGGTASSDKLILRSSSDSLGTGTEIYTSAENGDQNALILRGGGTTVEGGVNLQFNLRYTALDPYPTWTLAKLSGRYPSGANWGGDLSILLNDDSAADALKEIARFTYTEKFRLIGAGVAHGFTSRLPTNSFFQVGPFTTGVGGTIWFCATEANRALAAYALANTENTTKSSAGRANITFYAALRSGTDGTVHGAGGNLFAIADWNDATKFIIDQDATMWVGGLIKAPGLPTSSAGLSAGDLWVDTGAGNVVKRV